MDAVRSGSPDFGNERNTGRHLRRGEPLSSFFFFLPRFFILHSPLLFFISFFASAALSGEGGRLQLLTRQMRRAGLPAPSCFGPNSPMARFNATWIDGVGPWALVLFGSAAGPGTDGCQHLVSFSLTTWRQCAWRHATSWHRLQSSQWAALGRILNVHVLGAAPGGSRARWEMDRSAARASFSSKDPQLG